MSDLDDEISDAFFNAAIEELGDEVVEAIRAEEREMIIEWIRLEENIYEVGEDLANSIEELAHYDDEEIH